MANLGPGYLRLLALTQLNGLCHDWNQIPPFSRLGCILVHCEVNSNVKRIVNCHGDRLLYPDVALQDLPGVEPSDKHRQNDFLLDY